MTPRYAFIADDFTGATDTLATLAQAGLRTSLYLDADRMAGDEDADAVGLATAVRSLATPRIPDALRGAAAALARLRAPVSHYKVCSTWDSAPAVGSIGAAVAALRAAVPHAFLPLVGGQPNLRRYCVFGTLFAGAGADGEVHRIDRHPTMSVHPVTPMHEADLARHLAVQGIEGTRNVSLAAYDRPLADLDGPVLFDILDDAHLAAVGEMLLRRSREAPLLAVGASSVAQALVAAWRREGSLGAPVLPPRAAPAGGPVFVLSGSRSPVTARQIAGVGAFESIALAGADEDDASRCLRALRAGRHVLAHSGGTRGEGPDAIAAAGARLLARIVDELAPARVGVSGGDTSSHAVRALGIDRLEYATQLEPGVALCRARGRRHDGLELMLKGGQMGSPAIFDRLIDP